MKIEVKLHLEPVNKMIAELGLDEHGALQRFHTQNVLNKILKYIPKKTGALRHLTQAQTNIAEPYIVTEAPGANMLYRGLVMEDPAIKAAGFLTQDGWKSRRGTTKVVTERPLEYTTPGTGPEWDKALVSNEGDALVADAQRFMDGRK